METKKHSIIQSFNINEVDEKLKNVLINDKPMELKEYMALEIEDILKKYQLQFPNNNITDAHFEYIAKDGHYLLAGEIESTL